MIVDDVFTRTLMKWLVVLLGFFVSALGAFFRLSSLSAIENLGLLMFVLVKWASNRMHEDFALIVIWYGGFRRCRSYSCKNSFTMSN